VVPAEVCWWIVVAELGALVIVIGSAMAVEAVTAYTILWEE
jgi:hypothetical protein